MLVRVLGAVASQRVIAVAIAVTAIACGEPCATKGCDALSDRALGEGSGLGGVVAYKSDAVENGCAECGFADATLEIFELDGALESEAEASAVVQEKSPLATLGVSARYRAPLDPGFYLVCVGTRCIDAAVESDAITTVNVKLRYGPTSFFVADPDTGHLVEDFGFEVTPTDN